MDIPIFPTNRTPQPRETVRIEELEVIPYPDRFRVYIHIAVTPFLERPNLLLAARNEAGQIVSELNVIETMHHDMEFTMHLRGVDDPAGNYTLSVDLFYERRLPPHDQRICTFIIPEHAG
jgi:hypothetical protein